LELFLSVVAIIFILYLCYVVSRFVSKRALSVTRSANIRIVERVALSQDKYLCIAEVCGSYYLLSVTGQRVEILKELNAADLQLPPEGAQKDFSELLKEAVSKMKPNKKSGEHHDTM